MGKTYSRLWCFRGRFGDCSEGSLGGMATSSTTIDSILAVTNPESGVSARKMFGEYGLFLEGKMVALVCDDILYLKPTPSGLAYLGEHELGSPYPGAKPCAIVGEKFLLKRGALQELLVRSWKELPAPKPRTPSKPKPKSR